MVSIGCGQDPYRAALSENCANADAGQTGDWLIGKWSGGGSVYVFGRDGEGLNWTWSRDRIASTHPRWTTKEPASGAGRFTAVGRCEAVGEGHYVESDNWRQRGAPYVLRIAYAAPGFATGMMQGYGREDIALRLRRID